MPVLSSEAAPGFKKYPDHKVTIQPSHSRIRVLAGQKSIADSTRSLLVEESRHGSVYYLPKEDVAMDLLQSSNTSTYCPFKGHASYWSIVDDPALQDSVWSYENPYRECADIAGYLAFYPDRLSVLVEPSHS